MQMSRCLMQPMVDYFDKHTCGNSPIKCTNQVFQVHDSIVHWLTRGLQAVCQCQIRDSLKINHSSEYSPTSQTTAKFQGEYMAPCFIYTISISKITLTTLYLYITEFKVTAIISNAEAVVDK